MSKETSNSVSELMKMPMHVVLGLFTALKHIFEEEEKARKEKEQEQSHASMPSMPAMPSSVQSAMNQIQSMKR